TVHEATIHEPEAGKLRPALPTNAATLEGLSVSVGQPVFEAASDLLDDFILRGAPTSLPQELKYRPVVFGLRQKGACSSPRSLSPLPPRAAHRGRPPRRCGSWARDCGAGPRESLAVADSVRGIVVWFGQT